MSCYVDNMKANFGRMKMCHLTADSEQELLDMADRIGVSRRWHQYPGTHRSHFDISLSKRAEAVRHGAIEISWRQTGVMAMRRRITGVFGPPDQAEEWFKAFQRNPTKPTKEPA